MVVNKDVTDDEARQYLTELYTEYAFGNILFFLRFYAKWKVGKLSPPGLDDYCAMSNIVRLGISTPRARSSLQSLPLLTPHG